MNFWDLKIDNDIFPASLQQKWYGTYTAKNFCGEVHSLQKSGCRGWRQGQRDSAAVISTVPPDVAASGSSRIPSQNIIATLVLSVISVMMLLLWRGCCPPRLLWFQCMTGIENWATKKFTWVSSASVSAKVSLADWICNMKDWISPTQRKSAEIRVNTVSTRVKRSMTVLTAVLEAAAAMGSTAIAS